jgi:hypothetical protein
MTPTVVKYVAELAHVREVSLLGTADLAFWRDWLTAEGLTPAERDGRAQILIVAADAKYLGVRFREVSFSVLVAEHRGVRTDGAYLVQAFNSCRFFAFCERAFFATPYHHGDVRVSASFPASIQLGQGGEVVFRAEMHADGSAARDGSRLGEGGWAGHVFLPGGRRGPGREGRLFFARIRGQTRTDPFLPSQDAVTLRPWPGCDVLQALLDSHFAGQEWAVREDATHAKSKTYQRSDGLARLAPGSADRPGA